MSYIRMYRNKFIQLNDLEYMYINHSLKFVEYIEQIGLGDKIVEINSRNLKDSVGYYCSKGVIKTINSMNNYLNAIKRFFGFLYKEGMAENIFNQIADYDEYRQAIINDNQLKPAKERGYFETEQINDLLDYFNSKPKKYANMTMMGFFFKIMLLAPTKRKVIANLKINDFTENFDSVTVNGFEIKIPRALSQDIKHEIKLLDCETHEDDLFFELFCGCKYSENVFNTPFYYALKEIGYDVPKDKDTFSVECIRNTGIVNLATNGANLYLLARLSDLTLSRIDKLLTKFEIDTDEHVEMNKSINQEISKLSFYQKL